MDPRIRIGTGSGSVPKFHGSAKLVFLFGKQKETVMYCCSTGEFFLQWQLVWLLVSYRILESFMVWCCQILGKLSSQEKLQIIFYHLIFFTRCDVPWRVESGRWTIRCGSAAWRTSWRLAPPSPPSLSSSHRLPTLSSGRLSLPWLFFSLWKLRGPGP
jgi:hypothetical protein